VHWEQPHWLTRPNRQYNWKSRTWCRPPSGCLSLVERHPHRARCIGAAWLAQEAEERCCHRCLIKRKRPIKYRETAARGGLSISENLLFKGGYRPLHAISAPANGRCRYFITTRPVQNLTVDLPLAVRPNTACDRLLGIWEWK
jgi:hypothetical protein